MISRKTLKIAGAAILGTFVGTGSAHAEVYLDADGDVQGQSQIAVEPLAATTTVEGEVYHDITPFGTVFDVLHEIGLSDVPIGSDIVLTYTLENMVFLAAIPTTDVTLVAADRTTAISTATASPLSGGKVNDSAASFVIRNTAVTAASGVTVYAKMDIGKIGLKVGATGGTGSVTMRAERVIGGRSFPGDETTIPMVKAEVILQEMANATSAQAIVSEGYEKFSDGTTDGANTVSIGTLQLGVNAEPNNRWTVTGDSGQTWATASLAGASGAIVTADGSRVTFAGPVDFVEDVYLSGSSACAQLGTPVSLVEDTDPGEGVTMAWKTGDDRAAVSAFESAQHICIEVDGDTAIPVVEKYTALAVYEALSGATYPPVGMSQDLGGITRDGTTVHLPALTTSDVYNQRLVMWNRGNSAVEYSITFTADGATAGADASGMLQPGVTNLSLMHNDVVTLSSGNRTAATLNVAAPPSNISVSTIQVNRETRGTDTVNYQ